MGGGVFAVGYAVTEAPSRKYFDELTEWFKELSGKGIGYLVLADEDIKGSLAKFVTPEELSQVKASLGGFTSGVIFFGAGRHDETLPHLGKLRTKVGFDLKTAKPDQFALCWIYDYPMYERDSISREIVFSHNPFSMPQGGLEALNTKDPLDILAYQYDVVCNGYELSSGAIRNHSPEIMYRAFEIAGYSKETVDDKFGGMIRAFKYGAPPHGGMAPGVDRITMLLAGRDAIRDVIAFPLAQTVEDLMMSAPSTVNFKQLNELHIQIKEPILPK